MKKAAKKTTYRNAKVPGAPAKARKKPTTPKEDADEKLLAKCKARFQAMYQGEKKWRTKRKVWRNYYDGEQWDEDEKRVLEERGQPATVINKIKPNVDGIVGIQMGMRTAIKALPRGLNDAQTATLIGEGIRAIEDGTDFEEEQPDAFEDALIDGRGWYKHEVKQTSNLFDDPDFKTYRVENDDMFLDECCKKADLSDAKDLCESVWVDLEDAKEMFPNSADELEDGVNDAEGLEDEFQVDELERREKPDQYRVGDGGNNPLSLYVDCERRRVRIVARWYREIKRHTLVYHPAIGKQVLSSMPEADQKKVRELFPGAAIWEELGHQLNCAIFTWCTLLEKKTNVRSWDPDAKFPFVMVPAFVEKNERRMPYGYVKQLIDSQDEINKRRSKMVHMMNVVQVEGTKGCIDDPNETRRQLAAPDGIALFNEGFNYKVTRGVELVQPHFLMYQEAKREIEDAGVNRQLTGSPAQSSDSGRKIQVQQQQVVQVLRKLFKNLRAAHKRVAQLWLEDMQHFKTGEWLVKVTDDPEVQGIVLNEVQKDAQGRPMMDPTTGEPLRRNRINVGKYDLKLEETENTLTLEQETFQALAQMGDRIPLEVLLEVSPIPNKGKIIKRMQQMQQQQMQAQAAAQAAAMQQQALAAANGGGNPQ